MLDNNSEKPAVVPRWKPGESGNPGGRPKLAHKFRKDCQESSAEVLQRLLFWLRSDDGGYSIRAGELILSYGLGKPIQQVQIESDAKVYVIGIPTSPNADAIDITPQQWVQEHRAIPDNNTYQPCSTTRDAVASLPLDDHNQSTINEDTQLSPIPSPDNDSQS